MTTVDLSWKLRAQKAEAKLREISELVKATNSDSCDNPGIHAACLDRCLYQIEGVIEAGSSSPTESQRK